MEITKNYFNLLDVIPKNELMNNSFSSSIPLLERQTKFQNNTFLKCFNFKFQTLNGLSFTDKVIELDVSKKSGIKYFILGIKNKSSNNFEIITNNNEINIFPFQFNEKKFILKQNEIKCVLISIKFDKEIKNQTKQKIDIISINQNTKQNIQQQIEINFNQINEGSKLFKHKRDKIEFQIEMTNESPIKFYKSENMEFPLYSSCWKLDYEKLSMMLDLNKEYRQTIQLYNSTTNIQKFKILFRTCDKYKI